MGRTAIICLGRHGDICNALPLALHAYQNGFQPTMVVSKPWASLLSGVSYCDCLPWDGDYSKPMEAKKWAESLNQFDQIVVPQCYGQAHSFECDNFCEEAWRIVGMRDMFGKIPLVFDRRDRVREANLLANVQADTKKPVILVNTGGISSPFPEHQSRSLVAMMFDALKERFAIVDISRAKAERFFDLLGMYEAAACLVTVDSGPLHLAQSTPKLPVIALITDQVSRWHGSPARQNHVLRIRYSEFDARKGEIVPMLLNLPVVCHRKLVHVWSDYPITDSKSAFRHNIARQTWESEFTPPLWVHRPVLDSEFTRNAKTEHGFTKTVPIVRELLQKGADSAGPYDIIVLTNDDTCVAPGITAVLLEGVSKHGAIWSSRIEHAHISKPMSHEQMLRGYKHVGADVFAFTKEWWDANKADFPDMYLSLEAWDLVLKKLILLRGGKEVDGLCYHQTHTPEWTTTRNTAAALHNQHTASGWFKKHGLPWT